MPKGIRKLDPRKPIPWEVEREEGVPVATTTKPVVNIVRCLGVSEISPGKVAAVYNAYDETGTRPAGWGMPGGRVDEGETPLEALLRHEGGEMPWPIVGDPIDLEITREREHPDRVERTYFLLAYLDENNPGEITAEEGVEVSKAELLDINYITKMPFVDMQPRISQTGVMRPSRPGASTGSLAMYFSHKKFFDAAWARYLELREKKEVR